MGRFLFFLLHFVFNSFSLLWVDYFIFYYNMLARFNRASIRIFLIISTSGTNLFIPLLVSESPRDCSIPSSKVWFIFPHINVGKIISVISVQLSGP